MASKATASMTPTQLGTLGKLPVELRLEIFKQLDYGSAIFLAATNRYFRSMIDPLSQISDADKTAFLRRAEHFAQHEPPSGKGLACYGCFRVKQENLFEPGLYSGFRKLPPPQLDRGHDFRDRDPPWQFCVACAQEPKVFYHGAWAIYAMGIHGIQVWSCDICNMSGATQLHPKGCGRCGHCVVEFKTASFPNMCPTCKGSLL
ncbi:uncharacterized protein BKA78DRAFT_105544 [Phyllosticta capitalensis]|uniref:uncharacterized protein n=1 Tax=Phyllosticta capitalensis TaxID=121624 RepID=UPI00312FEEFB